MTVWGRIVLNDEVVYERRAPNPGLWWYGFDRLLEKNPGLKRRWEEACQITRERMRQRAVLAQVNGLRGGDKAW